MQPKYGKLQSLTEPSWLSTPSQRRFATFVVGSVFAGTSLIVILTSVITLLASPLSDQNFEHLNRQPSEQACHTPHRRFWFAVFLADRCLCKQVQCLRVARRADYAVAFLGVGSPLQYLSVLVRMDRTVDQDAQSLDLFSPRLLKSLTLQCNETEAEQASVPHTTCVDTSLIYNGTLKQHYASIEFGFSSDVIKNAMGDRAYMLGLDGELSLVRGFVYWMTSTHLCWSKWDVTDAIPHDDESNFLPFNSDMTTSVTSLKAFDPLHKTPAAEGLDGECANLTASSVHLFPMDASIERTVWLVLGSAFLYEFGNTILDDRRHVVEIGDACASLLTDFTQVRNLYKIDCLHDYSYGCRTDPSVPYRRLADHRIRLDVFDDGSGELRAEKTTSLSRIPELSSFTNGLNAAFGRLFVLILTAAVVFVRGVQNASDSKFMMIYTIDLVHCRPKPDMGVLRFKKIEVATDLIITTTALGSRVLVFSYAWSFLVSGEHQLVLVYEIVGIISSFVHVFLRYVALKVQLDYETPLTKLAGPMSVIDVSAAVLLSFSEPPLLATHDGRFAAVGRLLIGILMSISVFTRCVFGATICALLAATVRNSTTYDRKDGNQGFQTVLVISTILWVLQAVSSVGSFAALFVQPAGFSLTRMLSGDVSIMRFCLLLGFFGIGLPTLNKTVLRTLEHAATCHEDDDASKTQ